MHGFRRIASTLLALGLLAAACSSGGDEDAGGAPTATTGSTGATDGSPTGTTGGATGTTGSTPTTRDACALVNEADATAALLGTEVERVEDPVGEELLGDPIVGTFESVCYFRPVPDDGERMVATIVFTPGSISDAEFEDVVADGSSRGVGHNFEAWEVEDTIFVRKGDVILLVRAVIHAGSSPDEATEFALASLAAARVPEASDGEIAACGVLTPEIVTSAIGGGTIVPSGGAEIDDQTTACGYAGATESVVVVLYLTTGPLAATRFADFVETQSSRDGFEGMDGLGDDAFQGSRGVVVLVGETLVDVQVTVDGYGTDVDAARTMAEAVVGSL